MSDAVENSNDAIAFGAGLAILFVLARIGIEDVKESSAPRT